MLKADEFSSVFSFRRSFAGEYFQIQIRPNGKGHPRLGLVVPRKTEKRAVCRNLVKRLVREYFRTHLCEFGSLDVVVRLRRPFGRDGLAMARTDLQKLAVRVAHVAAPDRTD